jgi:MSHA pilin protein MshC
MITAMPRLLVRKNNGFTLIELVTILVILGILSAVVLPKFTGARGFEEHAYRIESISVLRAIQQQAMQNTQASQCHQVLITANTLGRPDTNTCVAGPPTFSAFWADNSDDNTSVTISQDSVNFTVGTSGQYFSFDSLGRPVLPSCSAYPCPVDITIQGVDPLTIRIEAEGYIHAL